MDLAYANEQIYSGDRASTPTPPKDTSSSDPSDTTDAPTPRPESIAQQPQQRTDLSTELSETFKAFSASPWGAKLGGFWGNVTKQSQAYYSEAAKEVEDLRSDAIKGFNNIQESLASRARSLSIEGGEKPATEPKLEETAPTANDSSTNTTDTPEGEEDTETFLHRFRTEASRRLRDVQRAEDAADEALLRFGTNIRNFLRDAVAISAPEDSSSGSTEVIFESKDAATGKRVIHTSRFDAQLHVIHTNPGGFLEDPDHQEGEGEGQEWVKFREEFDVDRKTGDIAGDLERYPELRATMEGLVPEKVEYGDFWRRYYFLRHVLEVREEKRRELLKASTKPSPEEEIGWDSDDESSPASPRPAKPTTNPLTLNKRATESSTTLSQPPIQSESTTKPSTSTSTDTPATGTLEPPPPPRRSHDEKSVSADSEASYDMVSGAPSGAPSRAASSPKERVREAESDEEEDWE